MQPEQRAAVPVLEPAGGNEGPLPVPQFSLFNTLKFGILVAIAGWFTFLYFSNDNIPVSDYRLGLLLPKRQDGWKSSFTHSGNPSSVSIDVGLQFEKFTSSNSWRSYSNGDKEITVEIWDWAGDYPYHMPIDVPGWFNGEEVRAGAETGRLRYNPETKKGRLRVRYLDRFYLVVEGTGIERHELDLWYRRIDLAGLRRELEQLRAAPSSR